MVHPVSGSLFTPSLFHADSLATSIAHSHFPSSSSTLPIVQHDDSLAIDADDLTNLSDGSADPDGAYPGVALHHPASRSVITTVIEAAINPTGSDHHPDDKSTASKITSDFPSEAIPKVNPALNAAFNPEITTTITNCGRGDITHPPSLIDLAKLDDLDDLNTSPPLPAANLSWAEEQTSGDRVDTSRSDSGITHTVSLII